MSSTPDYRPVTARTPSQAEIARLGATEAARQQTLLQVGGGDTALVTETVDRRQGDRRVARG